MSGDPYDDGPAVDCEPIFVEEGSDDDQTQAHGSYDGEDIHWEDYE